MEKRGGNVARGMNNLQANICLLAVTLCWSCEVIIFSVIPSDINPFATTCVTSLIGALLVGICFVRRIAMAFKRDGKLLARRIAALSIMNTTYNVLNLVGLDFFDVSTGAFTLSMTVVVLPVMLLIMRRGVGRRTWLSAACVLIGIFIAVSSTMRWPQLPGLAVMALSCVIRALFIVKLNDYARRHDPVTLAAGMSGLNALISFVPWCVMQPTTFAALPWTTEIVAAYFVYSYFIVAFATVLNIFAQRRATPAQSTIIYSIEIVLSTIWATCLPATIVDPVDLTVPIVVGCALVVLGNLVEIVPVGSRKEEGAEEAAVEEESAEHALSSTASPARTGDFMSRMSAYINRPLVRKAALFALLLGVYLAISLPFKVLSIIPGFSEVRPVNMLQPVYGIFFGIPGCLAFAVGNLIGDIASDSLRWSSIAGFVGNFAGPYLMYLFWTKLRKRQFNLRHGKTIGLFVVTVVISAVAQTLIIAPAVAFYYPDVDVMLFSITVIINGTLFPVGFTIPFIILIQEELGISPYAPG